MAIFKIPLQNIPQQFNLTLGDTDYLLTCKWNDAVDAGWVLDFVDADTNEPIIFNVPLVTGVNILSGMEYLGFTGILYVYTDGNDFAVPALDNLGVESNLYFQTDDA